MIDEIKNWLKRHQHSREWLGQQTDTHKRTVDNWLSAGQPIPDSKLSLIRRLIADDDATETARRQKLLPQSQIFSLEVDLPTFRSYSAAALADGKTLEKWSIDELNAAAQQAHPQCPKPINYLKGQTQSQHASETLRIAEAEATDTAP